MRIAARLKRGTCDHVTRPQSSLLLEAVDLIDPSPIQPDLARIISDFARHDGREVTCAVLRFKLSEELFTPDMLGEVVRSLSLACPQLQWLEMPMVNAEIVPRGLLNMTSLTRLTIGHNQIETLPEAFCSNMTALRELFVENNCLVSLPEDIHLLADLRLLVVHTNQLSALPRSLSRLQHLIELRAQNNPLRELDDSFGLLSSLSTLDLSVCALTRLPDGFCRLPSLTSLDLRVTPLQQLPHNMDGLARLQHLYLTNCMLTCLPSSAPPQLQTLGISGNWLTSIPDTWLLGSLVSLDASCNQIEVIPESISDCHLLQRLDVSQNIPLSCLPAAICALPYLQSLNVSETSIRSLPALNKHAAPDCTVIAVNAARLQTFDVSVFSNLLRTDTRPALDLEDVDPFSTLSFVNLITGADSTLHRGLLSDIEGLRSFIAEVRLLGNRVPSLTELALARVVQLSEDPVPRYVVRDHLADHARRHVPRLVGLLIRECDVCYGVMITEHYRLNTVAADSRVVVFHCCSLTCLNDVLSSPFIQSPQLPQ